MPFHNCRPNIPGIYIVPPFAYDRKRKITNSVLENPEVISHLNSSIDCNIYCELKEEVKMNALEQMLNLDIRNHSFTMILLRSE